MGLIDIFRPKTPEKKYAALLSGQTPVFSQFGASIYASDLVQVCIDRIATECKKVKPRHIITNDDGMQKIVNGPINRLLRVSPNPLMTTSDFMEKVIWLLYLNYNAFIYPTYTTYLDAAGNTVKTYTGLYPLDPTRVTFIEDASKVLYVQFNFANGYEPPPILYSEIIHLRKKFSVNEVMGGGLNGQPDNAALLKALQVNDVLVQGLEKGVKAALQFRGIVKMNTYLASEQQKADLAKFETMIAENTSGLVPMDMGGDILPVNINPKLIDKDTLEYLEGKVLHWYGCSIPIINGDFTDEQKLAWYESTIEPLLTTFYQAFTKCLFTQRQLDLGNEIIFYPQEIMFSSIKNKTSVADILGSRGALTNNQLLGLFGWPPYDGGDERFVSLNFINAKLADQYQLKKAGLKEDANEDQTAKQ